ncbi:transmembrane protein 18 isoform X1 [Stomoxys calcitrans]|uniref:Transmembrane protein 18 n=1 Tax=Stomoxys calcitrans TaxID=35570 RepID=A0A1I8PI29_STOCA|nr:transmembrane protein 18 isoform X1 [Stomoxys calcitrans]
MAIDPNIVEVNEITDYWSFLMSIDWWDPWLIGLIMMHILTTTTTLMTRNNTNFQIFLFLILLSAVYFSESINEYAAMNWRSFSKQQYFDSNGLFISTVFSIPILLNCMILIGAWLYNSTQMMAKLKVAQLKDKLRRERLQQQASEEHLKNQ